MTAVAAVASLLLAACGSATGSGHCGPAGTGGTSVTAWIITTGPSPAMRKQVMRSPGTIVLR